MKKIFIILLGCVIMFAIYQYTKPNLFLSESSEDGQYSVSLYRKRIMPYIQGVNVIVVVKNLNNNTSEKQILADLDEWSDPLIYFKHIELLDENISISPGVEGVILINYPK